jgi:superfamily II helicase
MTFVFIKCGGPSVKEIPTLKEIIVNSNCLIPILLDYIKSEFGLDGIISDKEALDLCTESGEVIDLMNKGKEYAKKFLEPKNTYLLVKAIYENDEPTGTYIPLVDVSEKVRNSLINNPKKKKNLKVEEDSTSNASLPAAEVLKKATGASSAKAKTGAPVKSDVKTEEKGKKEVKK